MTVVWDTSVIVDILRGHPLAVAYAEEQQEVPFCSEITRVEILRAVRNAERAATERLLGSVRWLPVDESIARSAGELGRRYRRSHRGVSTAELVIASSAQQIGAGMATANVRHFPMFQGLKPPY